MSSPRRGDLEGASSRPHLSIAGAGTIDNEADQAPSTTEAGKEAEVAGAQARETPRLVNSRSAGIRLQSRVAPNSPSTDAFREGLGKTEPIREFPLPSRMLLLLVRPEVRGWLLEHVHPTAGARLEQSATTVLQARVR